MKNKQIIKKKYLYKIREKLIIILLEIPTTYTKNLTAFSSIHEKPVIIT